MSLTISERKRVEERKRRKLWPYKHQLVVHVESDVDKGQRLMQNRLLRWIAAYGHTSVNFGFRFISVGVITGKRLGDG